MISGNGDHLAIVPAEDIVPSKVEPRFNVLEPPRVQANESSYSEKDNVNHDKLTLEVRKATESLYKSSTTSRNEILVNSTRTALRNHSEELEVMKNKTLSQMGVLDGKENTKLIPKILYVKQRWNLSVSFEDIGNIMKDTAFLNKLKPLNLSGPTLTSTRNRTSNFSLTMPLKMGYCDCWEHYCSCCVQLGNTLLHLSSKTCANFTFVSKTHVSLFFVVLIFFFFFYAEASFCQ